MPDKDPDLVRFRQTKGESDALNELFKLHKRTQSIFTPEAASLFEQWHTSCLYEQVMLEINALGLHNGHLPTPDLPQIVHDTREANAGLMLTLRDLSDQ